VIFSSRIFATNSCVSYDRSAPGVARWCRSVITAAICAAASRSAVPVASVTRLSTTSPSECIFAVALAGFPKSLLLSRHECALQALKK
jgi:hypothetical protein